VRFDLLTVALLVLREDAPPLDEEAAAALQDSHMAYNADLHESGDLLAAGPLSDERYRGLGVWRAEPERVQALRERDPAVRAGRLSAVLLRWMVPSDIVRFTPTRLPRSTAEVARGEVGLDRFTLTVLTLRPDAPPLDERAWSALQDAHLAYVADLHAAGHVLVAGPLRHDALRELSIWGLDPEQVRTRAAADPSVREGRLMPRVMPWLVPNGAVSFSTGPMPRSMAEAAYE